MELEEQQLVIKWRSLAELKEKMRALLGELEGEFTTRSPISEVIPTEIEQLGLNTFSAAMLAVLKELHKSEANAVDARKLAGEMKERFPLFFSKKSLGEIAHGTIFPGQKMARSGLIGMKKTASPHFPNQIQRVYWSK
jgi:hypothetical protein